MAKKSKTWYRVRVRIGENVSLDFLVTMDVTPTMMSGEVEAKISQILEPVLQPIFGDAWWIQDVF